MMVAQPKISRALGVIGLWNVLGVQGLWMGAMPVAGGLVERAITCSAGYTACGDNGCVLQNRCCNQPAGWACNAGAACYTVSGTVDCYVTTAAAPTTARSCFDYTAVGCQDGTGCFKCASTAYPYCLTEHLQGATEIWIYCSTAAGAVTIATSTAVLTPSITASTAPLPTQTTTPGPTTTAPIGTTQTGPPVNTLSGGAIAGITISAFVAIAIIGVLAFLLLRNSNTHQTQAAPMENVPYPPPPSHVPYDPHMPQYQPMMGQTIGSPVSYQDHYANDQALKAHQPPHQPPAELS